MDLILLGIIMVGILEYLNMGMDMTQFGGTTHFKKYRSMGVTLSEYGFIVLEETVQFLMKKALL